MFHKIYYGNYACITEAAGNSRASWSYDIGNCGCSCSLDCRSSDIYDCRNSSCCGCSWCISVVDMIVDEVAIAVAVVAVVVVAAAAVVIIVVIAVAVVVGHVVHIRV
ncbi:hypothetical protein RhiirA1_543037 [Rhizophagus irregularis]|uniref:Uncharacterized protein n=1 Tax=Rhizophagus irregularis TaxID=588596 RepID=A0A2N0QSB2_9GLOM|nr:hypothetical protein RhiirA1_543037 [Rhizophagus irregularis]